MLEDWKQSLKMFTVLHADTGSIVTLKLMKSGFKICGDFPAFLFSNLKISREVIFVKTNPNSLLNMAWNIAEWMGGSRRAVDILWLYTGWVNNSMAFNIIEYILVAKGVIK